MLPGVSSERQGVFTAPGMWPDLTTDNPSPAAQLGYWNPETRVIDPFAIAESINDKLLHSSKHPRVYDDQVPNSCTLGIELNDPSCE